MIPENYGEIAIFHTEDGAAKVQIQAVVKDETIWLTQKAMGELFGCSTDNIGLHLKNIFTSEELDELSVTEKNSATAADVVKGFALDDERFKQGQALLMVL